MRWNKTHPLGAVVLIGLGVFLLVGAFWALGCFQSAELSIYDRLVAWHAGSGAADPRIVLVVQQEKDIRKYDYPLRDSVLARLLATIEQDHPRAVGIDLYRDLPEPRDGSELNQLNQELATFANIICIFRLGSEVHAFGIPPPALLAGSPDRVGFNDFVFDDKTVRRGLIFDPDLKYSSLAWQLALLYLTPTGLVPGSEGQSIQLGKSTLRQFTGHEGGYVHAPSGGYQFFMDFRGPQKFTTYSVDEVLSAHATGAFQDKIVLIGEGSDSSGDFSITPLSAQQAEAGVVIHAQSVNQYLRAALDGDRPTVGVNLATEAALLLLGCLLAAGMGHFCHAFWSFAVGLTGCLIGWMALVGFFFLHGYWLVAVAPGAAILAASIAAKAYTFQIESRNRSALMHLFSKHVSRDVAESIWAQREEFLEGNRPRAQKVVATVLFTDLKNYSTLSEKLSPDDLMQWINECLGTLAQHVDRNGGIVNKFIGDAIMAVFGIPVARKTEEAIRQDAIHAVQCAVDMKAEMIRLNDKWQARGLPRVGLRIGIYTGELMAGTLGHNERLEYTVIGDSVNTASRLEGHDKENTLEEDSDCRILVGEPTFNLVKENFNAELVGNAHLKGQTRLTPFYRIAGSKHGSSTSA